MWTLQAIAAKPELIQAWACKHLGEVARYSERSFLEDVD